MMRLIMIVCTLLGTASAQDLKIPEPQWDGNVLYVNQDKGVELEFQKAYVKTKANAALILTGFGRVASKRYVKGAGSPIRITEKDSVQFIVRNVINTTDPRSLIQVFELDVSSYDLERYIEVGSVGSLAGAESGNLELIKFSAEKYGEYSYLITIPHLSNGQYAICLSTTQMDFRLFSVGLEKTDEEKARENVEKGDVVWFKNAKGVWTEATMISKGSSGMKLSYVNKSGKTKVSIVAFTLISAEKKE